jgi:fibronectin-binding autotransporter adhesin
MTVSALRPLHRRASLLGSSMLNTVALAAIAAVGVSMVPEAASAFPCNAVGTSLYCNGPIGSNTATGFNVVDLGAPPPNGTGVATAATGTQTFTTTGIGSGLNVTLENNGTTIATAAGDGLDINSDHAVILTDFGAITATAGTGVNIQTTTSSGGIAATVVADVTGAGANSYGVNAIASGATANVTVNALDSNISGVLEGINAQGSGSGTVTVESSISSGAHATTVGAISGSNGDGIFARNASGAINIGLALNPILTGGTTALGVTGGDGNGIFARTTAGGAINAYIGTGLYTGVGYNGLWLDAENGGDVSLNANGAQFAGSIAGVEADTFGSGTVTIAGTNIAASGATGAGIGASSQDGEINIGSSTTRLTTGVGLGANITSTGGDGLAAATIGNGSINIYAGSGVFQSELNAVGGAGIAALGESPAGGGALLVDLSGSSVQGDRDGVDVMTRGSGSVSFNGLGTFIGGAGGRGLDIETGSATAGVSVNVTDSAISGEFAGIFASAAGSGTVTVLDTISPGAHIVGTAGVVHASNGDGLYAASGSGTVNIGTALNPILTSNDAVNGITGLIGNGIVGKTTTGGAINLYIAGGLVTGTDHDGAFLDGGAGAIVTVSASHTGFDGAVNGVEADTNGAGAVTIDGTSLAASAGTGSGVAAVSQDGDINIGSSTARLTTGIGLGANITSTGGDGMVAATFGNGSINIYAGSGVYQSELNTVGGAGIAALGETAGGAGALLVDLSGSSVQGNYDGVDVVTRGSGSVGFNGLGAFVTGAGGRGLDIETGSATAGVSVNITDSAISGEFAGIFASAAGSGTVTVLDTISPGAHIVGTAGVVHAANGDGLYAASGSGAVNIGTALNPILTSNDAVNGITGIGGNGIVGKTTTGGAINLYTGLGLITGTGGEGAFLDGGPGAAVTVNALNTSFNGSDSGLYAVASGAGTVTITSNGGAIAGDAGAGVVASTENGLVTVGTSGNRITTGLSNATGITSNSSDAIGAGSFGAGPVDVYAGAGFFISHATVAGAAGIGAASTGGAVTVDLAGSDVAGFDGVSATSTTATATVNALGGVVAGNRNGLDVSGTGVTVSIGAGQVVGGISGHGVLAASSGAGGGDLQFAGASGATTVIEGLGTGPTTGVVDVAQITGASTVITNGAFSTIKSLTGHDTDLAIHVSGSTGSVRIGNTGVIDGVIDLGGLTDAGASLALSSSTLFNNGTGGVWDTAGTDVFGSGGANGVDTLFNSGSIGTSGAATTFTFGAATTNTFTNGGTLTVGEATSGSPQPYASALVITHLGSFNNSGLIVLGDGAATPERSLTAAGAAFNGFGASTLQADAQLGGPGSTADTLNVGSTVGATSILIRDVDAGVSGNTGPAGITLITTTGANAQSVTLNPGSSGYQLLGANAGLVKGLFFYSLVQKPTATLLVSALDAHAYDFTYLAGGARQIWYATAPWQDRQADLRDSYTLEKGDNGGFEPGLWMKAVGDWADRKASVTPTPGFTLDTSYLQDTSGLIGGLDAVRHGRTGEALFGVSTGYVSSTMDFDSGATRARYEGWTAGAYATYLSGAFFIDGEVKGDVLKLSINEPGTFDGKADADSVGGQVETGLRLPVGGMTLEPVGSLAYLNTRIGDYVVSGTTVKIGDNESFRGSLGLRLSADLVSNDHLLLKLAGDARIWDEFASGDKTAFLSSGPEIDVTDPIKGAFGETGLSLNLYSRDGHSSGFFNTSVKFKSGYTDDKIAVGFRYQWGGAAAR